MNFDLGILSKQQLNHEQGWISFKMWLYAAADLLIFSWFSHEVIKLLVCCIKKSHLLVNRTISNKDILYFGVNDQAQNDSK